MQNEHWAEIRTMISVIRQVPEIVVDHMSILNLIKMCANGLGNMKIGYYNDLDVEVVEKTLFRYVGFKGWDLDLDLNPWRIYCTTQGNYELYEMKILSLTNLVDYDIIHTSYKICKKYEQIREEINKYD
jgi:hypothetical protein